MSAYGRLAASFYDADKPLADDREAQAWADALPRNPGLVLEPMCGSGRLLVPLARRGLSMHGVDTSAAMIERCEARLAAEKLTATLFRQDIAQLNLPFRYGAAIIPAGSFQLVTDPQAAAEALRRVRAHLIEPGVLLIDAFVPGFAHHALGAPLVELRSATLGDGSSIRLRSESTIDVDARLASISYRYMHRAGAKSLGEESERQFLTWYPQDELVALLRDAGFREVSAGPPIAPGDGERYAVRAVV